MNLALVCASLGCGGAERVLTLLANAWTLQGHSVRLVTLAPAASDFHSVHPGVRRVGLDLLRPSPTLLHAYFNNRRRIRALRTELLQGPTDAVISFVDETNVLVLMALKNTEIPVVVSERIDPSRHSIGRVWNFLRSRVYPRASTIVVQTQPASEWLRSRFPATPIRIIPNPIDLSNRGPEVTPRSATSERMIAVGRLVPQKGLDLLLRAFASAQRQAPHWTLTILGEGEQRPQLEGLIAELDLTGKVQLEGRVSSPDAYLRNSDLFVLPSRYEGFPNALLEAMSFGLPVVSFDCPSGPREIIADGEDGILVPNGDVEHLSKVLTELMHDPDRRRQLGLRAAQSIRRFALPAISAQWIELLIRVTQARP